MFTILFIGKEKKPFEKNNLTNNDNNNRNGDKKTLLILNLKASLYLNHVWPLFSQTEDVIIINKVFVTLIIFFIFFLFIILFIDKEKPADKNNPNNDN